MGSGRRFSLDTNILVYSLDTSDTVKHRTATTILDAAADADCVLTLQSVSEFYYAVTRKRLMAASLAAELAETWLTIFPHTRTSATAVQAALRAAVAGRASYWDALLVATAAEAGCEFLLSEDMADGSVLGDVRIHNPFGAAGALTDLTRELLGL